jgi:hypothetical protein
MKPRFNSYNVRPRYTPGSPAAVDEDTARRVGREERDAYEHALSGIMGERERERAELLGLEGIAYTLHEHGSGRKFRWVQTDLITGRVTLRMQPSELEREGYLTFHQLPPWARELVLHGALRTSDLERRYWKLEAAPVEYQPEESAASPARQETGS